MTFGGVIFGNTKCLRREMFANLLNIYSYISATSNGHIFFLNHTKLKHFGVAISFCSKFAKKLVS